MRALSRHIGTRDTFEAWCADILGKNRSYVCRLITAGDTMLHAKQLALAAGRQTPDGVTVRQAAVLIDGTPKAKERAAADLIQRMERIERSLKISIDWSDMEPREVERLRKAFGYIIGNATKHLQQAPKKEVVDAFLDAVSGDK
jgi:hypothetical protein